VTSTYELYKDQDDHTLVTMLLVAEDLDESLAEADRDNSERGERLRMLVTTAQLSDPGYGDAGQASQPSGAGEYEQAEEESDEATMLVTADGTFVPDGAYRFVASVAGSLQLKNGEAHVAWLPDTWDVPLGAEGWIVIAQGAAGEPELDPPPPPADDADQPDPQAGYYDPSQFFDRNVGILNAMFVDGAGASQRTARVLSNGLVLILKNINEGYADEQRAGLGVGTITFVRNRMSPNEIVIADEGGLDVKFVKQEIKDLLIDRDVLDYPYRDRKRVNVHD
jgi:hypothetical protein